MNRHNAKINSLNLPLFEGVAEEQLSQWNSIAIMYKLYPGDILYRQGERANSFYIILSGGLRLVEYTDEGKAVTVKVYGEGDMIGLLSLSEEHNHAATVEAVNKTMVVSFRSTDARKLLSNHGMIAMRLVDGLTRHVHHAHDRIRHLAAEKTEKRLARALLHFHHKFGHVKNGVYTITAELSQRDISEFTGTTLETVNRYLKQWEKSGLIKLSYKHIDILRPEDLENIAASVNHNGYLPE